MTDPYQQHPNPYGQQPPYGANPYGGQGQPDYGASYGPPDPYGAGQPQPGQPMPGQPMPGQPMPGQPQPGQYGAPGQPDPYATRQYEPGFGQPGQPGQPDQYGQYQGSFGQPGWGGGGGLPPEPPPKSKAPMVVVSVLAVLVIVGAVIVGFVVLRDDDSGQTAAPPTQTSTQTTSSTAQQPTTEPSEPTGTDSTTPNDDDKVFTAGECAGLTPEGEGRARLSTAECGSDQSDVLVAQVLEPDEVKCDDDFITFTADVEKLYCLALDADEGDCFELETLPKRALSCQGADTYEAVTVHEGVADPPRCQAGEDDKVYAYPDPARTLCFVTTDST